MEFQRVIVNDIRQRADEPRSKIQVIVGPRQVGKTFAVEQATRDIGKYFAYRLAESLDIDPLTWLEMEWNNARIAAKRNGKYLLIIDEIQKIQGWSERVKRLWDEDTFNHIPLKVLLLGSSRLLLQKGLYESLEGRFELMNAWHWSFEEMHAAFGYSVEDYIMYGGYPGAAQFKVDEARFRHYIKDSIIEPSVSRDILQMERITKPELLRQVFTLGSLYSGRILSYQKVQGQLQDAGNITTIAHYLRLLGEAGLVTGLEKYYEESVRTKASSPKFSVFNNSLMTVLSPYSFDEQRNDPAKWGRIVESAVGAHLLATAKEAGIDVLYWNVGIQEVDYVLRKGELLVAIEVKSAVTESVSGMREFLKRRPDAKAYLIGGQGMPLAQFFTMSAADLF